MNNNKKCFVIMPFSKTYKLTKEKWAEIFEYTIKPAVEESGLGYKCERFKLRRANITKDILQELDKAHVVIADLTGSNPNVLWELGVRHILSNRTILIAQDERFLPSDLKDYPIIPYKYKQAPTEVAKFKQDIKDKLEDIEANPENPDSPAADFLGGINRDLLSTKKSENSKKLTALISQLSYNLEAIGTIAKQARANRRKREKDATYLAGSDMRLDISSLDLLLSTHYILVAKDTLEMAMNARNVFVATNAKMDCWHDFNRAPDIDDKFVEFLPIFKKDVISLLKKINKIRLDYINSNYQEPKEPIINLASGKHERYIK